MCVPSRGARGATWLEISTGAVALFLVCALAWQLQQGSSQMDSYIEPDAVTQQDPSLAVLKMIGEIREGGEIFYPCSQPPAPSDWETRPAEGSGIGFVNSRGEPIVYYLEDVDTDPLTGRPKPRALVRTNLKTRRNDTVAANVRAFRVIVPPHRAGKRIVRANLELSVLGRAGEDPGGRGRLETIVSICQPAGGEDPVE